MSYILSKYHFKCEWCGKTLGFEETENSKTVITNPCTEQSTTVYLCKECKQFPSKESMELWKGYIVKWALLNVPVRLDKIESICENGEWKVTLNFTVKYGTENVNVRHGWIA